MSLFSRFPLLRVAYWLPIPIVFTQYGYAFQVVSGRSMQPTLNPDTSQLARDIVLVDRFTGRVSHKLERGDIVTLRSPRSTRMLVKRAIALEGDVVRTMPPCPVAEMRVPKGAMWVEGDESFHTDDSNSFGPVPLALADGRMTAIVYPFSRFGSLKPPQEPHMEPGAPRGPEWYAQKAAYERELRRAARVTVTKQQE